MTVAPLAVKPVEFAATAVSVRPAVDPARVSTRGSSPKRRDVQGLRALAVVAVVGDHLVSKPTGGFLGVDIFFVISGFLITGLLLREFRRDARLDLTQFYKRRIKRTVPVAWVVLGMTLAVGSLILPLYSWRQLATGAVSAGSFWSNWQLIALGTDYLHATDAPTAVQHYWSLAVEEQFYLVWPALLLVALTISRLRTRRRAVVPALIAVGVLASVAWAAWETHFHPTGAYFSPFTRGWEPLAGAALAVGSPHLQRIPQSFRPWLAWAGLLLLIGGLVGVTKDFTFPFPWAFIAVAGTALVISSDTNENDSTVWPLSNALSQYVGKISYSIYLWHFPIVVFAAVLNPGGGLLLHVVELALIVVLASLSFHLIEEPLRTMSWRRPHWRRPTSKMVLGLSSGLVAVVLLSTCVLLSRHPAPIVLLPISQYGVGDSSRAQAVRATDISTALRADAWPSLIPDEAGLGEGARVPEWTKDGCLNAFGPEKTASRCVYGNPAAAKRVVLYGDSVALSYLPALRAALGRQEWRIEVLTDGQCPAIAIPVTEGDGTTYKDCDAYHDFALERIESERPDLVVVTSSYLSLDRLASGARDVAAAAEWRTGTAKTMRRLAAAAAHVLVLDAPPIEASPQTCKTPISTPRDCAVGVPENWLRAADAQRAGVSDAAARNIAYPTTLPWFCDARGVCPSFVDGVVTLADGMHLTLAGSRQLAPLVKAAVVNASN